MKFFGKKVAKALLLVMILSVMAGIGSITFAETIGNSVLKADNFEGYAIGTTFNTVGTHTLGDWTIKIPSEGDSVTVERDPYTKSLALKIVKGSTTNDLDVTFEFGNITSGKARVTYDARFQNHSKKLQNWGEVRNNSNVAFKKVLLYSSSYWKNQIGNASADYLFGVGAYNQSYVTLEQNFDLSTGDYSIKGYNKGVGVVNKLDTSATQGISKLLFRAKSATDGHQGSAVDSDTENNPNNNGIYWIDNVKAETITDLTNTLSIKDDFEGYAEGTTFNTIGRHSLGNLIFIINNEGDSVKVERDPVTNNLALRLEKSTTTSNLEVYYNFGEVTQGKAQFKFDMRFQNHSKKLFDYGKISNVVNMLFYQDGYWRKQIGNPSEDYLLGMGNYVNEYMTMEHTVDMAGDNYSIKVYDNAGIQKANKTGPTTATSISQIMFKAQTSTDGYQGKMVDTDTVNNPDNNGIYWIDNVSAERMVLGVKNTSIQNNATNVLINNNITFTFNDGVNSSDVNTDKIKVYKNGNIMDGEDYRVFLSTEDNALLNVTVNEGLQYGTDYKVIIAAGMHSVNEGVLPMENAYELIFKTEYYTDYKELIADDFTNHETGALASGGNWTVTVASGDTLAVADDAKGNRALKLVRLDENLLKTNATKAVLEFDERALSGKVKLSFDIRFENHRGGLWDVCSLQSPTGNIIQLFTHSGYFYANQTTTTSPYNFYTTMSKYNPDEYVTVERLVDLDNGTFDIFMYQGGNLIESKLGVLCNKGEAAKLSIEARYQSPYTLYSANTGDGIYWFDNIKVEQIDTPSITWEYPLTGAQNVETDTDVMLYTQSFLLESSVTKSNILVYENDVLLDNYEVSVDRLKNIKITFANGLNEGKRYKIKVSGVKSNGEGQFEMTMPYETSFTTAEKFIVSEVTAKTALEDDKMVYSATLKNSDILTKNYDFTVAMFDSEDKLVDVKYISESIDAGQYKYVNETFDIPENSNGYKLKSFVWNNMAPLYKKIEAASPGKRTYGLDVYNNPDLPLKVGYIGGSITQQLQYTTPLSNNFFKANQPDRSITFITSGVGGTGSDLGLYRLQKDIIIKKPDVVFIEFAVNDSGSSNSKNTMECMIRQLMDQEHQPVVILLYMPQQSGTYVNSVNAYAPLLEKYKIGAVNVGAYIDSNTASESNPSGIYVWKTADKATYPNAIALTNTDGVHPNADGGAAYAGYIVQQLNNNPENYFKVMNKVETADTGFKNPKLIPWNRAIYSEGWRKSSNSSWEFTDGTVTSKVAGSSLTYKFKGSKIALFAPKGSTGTSANYSIDGGAYTGSINLYSNTTDMPMPVYLRSDLTDTEHTLTITVNDNPSGEINFTFAYFMVD